MGETIKSYKGFNKDMTCRGFQYEEGKEYETDEAKVCEKGFHACEYPLDCFSYYNPAESVYHKVEQSGEISKHKDEYDDTKLASTKIKIGAKLSIAGIVQAAIEYTSSRAKKESDSDSRKGASSATGDYGASSATGNCGASSATGYKGASSAKDKDSIAVAWGYHGKAKGVLGSYLVLADWEGDECNYWTQDRWSLKGAKMVRVDGEKIKENTFYTMVNGEIVEVIE